MLELRTVPYSRKRLLRSDLPVMGGVAAAAVFARVAEPAGPRKPLSVRGRQIPSLCLHRRLTGMPCPSCGVTRGSVYMFRRDVKNAFRANPLSPLFFIATVGWSIGNLLTLLVARRHLVAGPSNRLAQAPFEKATKEAQWQ